MVDGNHPELEKIAEQAKLDTERFRANAINSLSEFTPSERKIATDVATAEVSIYDVLSAWKEHLRPLHQKIDAAKTVEAVHVVLAKALGFDAPRSEELTAYLVSLRKHEALEAVLADLYKDATSGHAKQIHAARTFLSQPLDELTRYDERYTAFAHHLHVANTNEVTVCDPYASWVERRRCAMQVRKEREKNSEDEVTRLHDIDLRLQALGDEHEGLLGEMIKNGWDFVTVMDLRSSYEKQIAALPDDKRRSPTKRLRVFDKVTAAFRDKETEKLAAQIPDAGLKTIRQLSENIDKLLLRIFDLSNTQKNKLLLDMKEYRELTQEKSMIHMIRDNRHSFL
jgi:hypothetical protein